ncbi:porin [Klebsiella pneumoniae]|nr:porin [Klebsiella pneumoniae]
MRVGVKGETQINDQLTGYGPVGIQRSVRTTSASFRLDQALTRLASAGLKFRKTWALSTTVVPVA